MEHMTVKDIVTATEGRLLSGDENTILKKIRLDSRTVEPGDLFVPLIGEKVDAHKFASQVMEASAGAVLTSRHTKTEGPGAWIQVKDTKEALQAIGSFCRSRISIPVVGITGSVGKTTTREMVAAALSSGFQVYKTPGNSNSQVGVPITISEISQKDHIAVLELGMSEPGELTRIAKIARPSMALITNIGVTHIEQLGSQENIYREKLTIQDGLEPGGILFLNGDDKLLKNTKARDGFRTIYYGTEDGCDYRAENIREEKGYPVFYAVHGDQKVLVSLKVMGRHNILNAMAAIAVAEEAGLTMEQAALGLTQYTGFKGRQNITEYMGITVIDDSYNASPVSMKAGIDVLCSMPGGRRKIAVLADMKELGPDTEIFHREVGEYIKEKNVDALITLGQMAFKLAESAGKGESHMEIRCFENRDEMTEFLKTYLKAGDQVLFKGSNSMKLGETAACFTGIQRS